MRQKRLNFCEILLNLWTFSVLPNVTIPLHIKNGGCLKFPFETATLNVILYGVNAVFSVCVRIKIVLLSLSPFEELDCNLFEECK